jgi:hypothetical protein
MDLRTVAPNNSGYASADPQKQQTPVYQFQPQVVKWLKDSKILGNDSILDTDLLQLAYAEVNDYTVKDTGKIHQTIINERSKDCEVKTVNIGFLIAQLCLINIDKDRFYSLVTAEDDVD